MLEKKGERPATYYIDWKGWAAFVRKKGGKGATSSEKKEAVGVAWCVRQR